MDSAYSDHIHDASQENVEAHLTSRVTETAPDNWDGRERRMNIGAYNYWESLLDGRPFPAVADLDPDALQIYSAHALLIDFTKGYEEPVLRYVGSALREESGLPVSETGPEAVPRGTVLSRLTDHYLEILANRAPVGFEAEFTHNNGNHILYRGILMPLSDDGDQINFIYGVVSWKLDIDAGTGAQAEVALPEDDLLTLLEQGQAAAQRFSASDQRSRSALYETLEFAHIFACASKSSPNAYQQLLKDVGLKAQKRAPYTPVVKLVFGLQYDKSRVAEYATVLAHADRQQVKKSGFADFIQTFDGGLKAIVAAERRARRGETALQREERVEKERQFAKQVKAVATADIALDHEFCLLLSRPSPDGSSAEILGSVPVSEAVLKAALHNFAKAHDDG